MSFGKKLKETREEKKLTRSDLAEQVGISHVMVGRYERDETMPTVGVAKNIADALNTSIDYLAGDGTNASFDKGTVRRLEEIQNLPHDVQEKMWFFIDVVIRDYKTKQTYTPVD